VPSRRPHIRFSLLVFLVGGLAAVVFSSGVPRPEELRTAVATLGLAGPLLAVAGTAMLSAAMVPRTVLAAAGGLLFGPFTGAAYVLIGAAAGALVAFAIGRWLGRDFIATRRRAAGVDRWLGARGFLGVLTLRLLPIAPFGLVSYAFGTTAVSMRAFLAGTALAIVPSTVVYASLGAHALAPGTAGFAWSLAAALALPAVGVCAAAVLGRQRANQDTVSTPVLDELR
jgi:uncharacterized membrane protein YdjX (TVP38/TMEM64 family)